MILTAQKIEEARDAGDLTLDPFDPQHLNPNSYNFHLGDRLLTYTQQVLDPRQDNPTATLYIPDEGLILEAGHLYLGHTVEKMGAARYVPMIFARSSIARLGLFVQITAPLGDIGFIGQWTLQLTPVHDLRVYPGMALGQILFFEASGEIDPYDGKYQGAQGPVASRGEKP